MVKKRILAVDVGAGTQDILLYDSFKEPENNIKLVLPSQTQLLARKIAQSKNGIRITGEIMGGGPITVAILNHLKKGHRVVMTEVSAKTVRDNLEEVVNEGIEVVSIEEASRLDLEGIEARDVDVKFIFMILSRLGEGVPDSIGIAVQDHGYERNKSDRAFRFEKIKERLEKGGALKNFLFKKPPTYYSRMNAVLRDVKKDFDREVFVIDSKFAAIAGALNGVKERPCLCVDIGNGHTMAAVVDNGIKALFEHHTHSLTRVTLEDYIERLSNGELTNEEVFNDHGHGCHVVEAVGLKNIKRILVSGPNRRILNKSRLKVEFANPFGDIMMTGPVGIVSLIKARSQ